MYFCKCLIINGRSKPKILNKSRYNKKLKIMKKITLLMLIVFMTIAVHAQNKLLSSVRELNNNGTWQNSDGTNYEYDNNNNLVAETTFTWKGATGVWESDGKTTYTYNINNKITQALYVFQNWNLKTNQPLGSSFKDIYTYTNGKLTNIEMQDLMGSEWVNVFKIVIVYNSNNLLENILYYKSISSQWVNNERQTYSYNPNNTLSSEINEEWIGAQWVNSFKSLNFYNSDNKLIFDIGANWDVFNNIWVEAGAHRIDYEWDPTGNRIRKTNSGNFDYREEYTYNSLQLMDNFVHPFKDKTGVDYLSEGFPYVNKLLRSNGYNINPNTNGFEISSRTTYNYNSLITLGAETMELANASITVHPNPTKDFLYIQNPSNTEINKITVTDLTGKIILQNLQNTTQVDVQKLSQGMYFLQVLSGKEKFQTKFIKD